MPDPMQDCAAFVDAKAVQMREGNRRQSIKHAQRVKCTLAQGLEGYFENVIGYRLQVTLYKFNV